jgi:hypothetical protein
MNYIASVQGECMSNTRGVGVLGALEYFDKIGGAEGKEKMRTVLSKEDFELFYSGSFGALDWVNYPAYIRLLLAADKVLGNNDQVLIRESSKYEAQKSFSGIYGIFLSIISPRFVINKSSMLWKKYYDSGDLTVTNIHKNDSTVIITDFPDIPLHHDISTLAYMEEALILSGCKNVRGKHSKCIARGDDCCLFFFQWD